VVWRSLAPSTVWARHPRKLTDTLEARLLARWIVPRAENAVVSRHRKESEMCLTCGCMDAHKEMGDNVTYEDLKRMADGNGNSVEETLDIITRTADIDRERHQAEYTGSAQG
jgi:hypothetical protein